MPCAAPSAEERIHVIKCEVERGEGGHAESPDADCLDSFKRGVAMKFAIGVAVFLWLLCGAVGAWINDDLDSSHWQEIVYGAVTLADALNEHPVTYPGPG